MENLMTIGIKRENGDEFAVEFKLKDEELGRAILKNYAGLAVDELARRLDPGETDRKIAEMKLAMAKKSSDNSQ